MLNEKLLEKYEIPLIKFDVEVEIRISDNFRCK